MSSQKPSRKLMFVLGICVLLAVFTVGRSFVGGSSDSGNDDYVETFEPLDSDRAERTLIDDWTPPPNPRDPFLPVDING